MYQVLANYSYRDYAVSRAIIELQKSHDLITADMVASHCMCAESTAARSIQFMMRTGILKRVKGSPKQGGYRYEYTGK